MLADPLPLQTQTGDVSFGLVSQLGTKSIRTTALGLATDEIASTVTISNDVNEKTARKRTVLRVDIDYSDSLAVATKRASAYLVMDREVPDSSDVSQVHTRNAIATILSFFTTDPTAASSGNLNYAITTSNGNKLMNGES